MRQNAEISARFGNNQKRLHWGNLELIFVEHFQDEFGEKLQIPYLIGRDHSGTYSCVVDTHVDRIVLVS